MFYYSVLSFSIEIIYYCLEKRELQELPNFMTSWKVSGLRRVMHIVKVWLLFEACGIFLVSNRNHQAWNVWCLCLMISKDLITSRTSITQTSLNGISEHMWSVTFVKSGKFSLQYVCLYWCFFLQLDCSSLSTKGFHSRACNLLLDLKVEV